MAGPFLWPKPCVAQIAVPTNHRSRDAIARQGAGLRRDLTAAGLNYGAPLFIRIVKSVGGDRIKAYLELFVEKDGLFVTFRQWPVCYYSGTLGPKLKEGDGQSPEGFYWVPSKALNPNSSYHLSFNLGYPNAFDRHYGRTGSFLMVHGRCVSIGCYAMGDNAIEQIFTLMTAAYKGGQNAVRVHIFPFEMNNPLSPYNIMDKNALFWMNLKQGWDHFEAHKRPPNVVIHKGHYIFQKI